MSFYGHHGISIGNVVNITFQNSEISFIGGMTQKYQDDGRATRLGNAIQVWGEIKKMNEYSVNKGMYLYTIMYMKYMMLV